MSDQNAASLDPQRIADLRRDYRLAALEEAAVQADPVEQFHRWLAEALAAQLPEPNAMTLATVDTRGRPAARVVLLKALDARGFAFYTNLQSRKGRELAANPHAALVFLWTELERQVRVEGRVEPVADDEADAYFASRPLSSRIGAWASPQSELIESREVIERREAAMRARFGDAPPRPPHWGGLRVVPEAIEFWQGRRSRLHDRLLYTRSHLGGDWTGWSIGRLAP